MSTSSAGTMKHITRRTLFNATILSVAISPLLLLSVNAGISPNITKHVAQHVAKRARPVADKSVALEISPAAKIARVVVKFVDGSAVRQPLGRGGAQLVSLTGQSLAPVETLLADYMNSGKVAPLLSQNPVTLDARRSRLEKKSGLKLADLGNYYEIQVASPAEASQLVNELNSLAIVETAYPEPEVEPAVISITTTSPNFNPQQTYLRPAPDGVDADFAATVPGGDGSGVKVIDIEGGWRTTHEELASNPPFVQIGGQIGSLDWRNHGTAVIGEMLGDDDGIGITGIAPGVQWGYSSIAAQSTANALQSAGSNLNPGDLILIELHAPGPHFNFESRNDQLGYVCMEYFQANFDVIQQLFLDGIVVCEAAGNGAENYDDANLYGQLFDTTFRNSHAIICGAGAPPSGAFGADRTRLSFSNYGERVNLQGYGAGVYTTGYGDAFTSGAEDTWYTAFFSGTSSASPIITGSVAALQGAHKSAFGISMTSDEIRTLLDATGSPQTGNTGQHIGPRPDLQAAFNQILGVSFIADTTVGVAPLDVQFSGLSNKTVTQWMWDFGDGDSAMVQSPAHTYSLGGVFDVSLLIESLEGQFSTSRAQYVVALADTLDGLDTTGAAGGEVRVDVYARNTLPVYQVKIPVEWSGPLSLSLDSASVLGLRSSHLVADQTSINPINDQAVYTLTAPNTGTGSYLQPGTGPIVSFYFSIAGGASPAPNTVSFSGFFAEQPMFVTDLITFTPVISDAEVTLCLKAGDADGNDSINISDVTFLIAMIFSAGPLPVPQTLGDANCDSSVNIADVTFLINMIFAGGPLPCECAL